MSDTAAAAVPQDKKGDYEAAAEEAEELEDEGANCKGEPWFRSDVLLGGFTRLLVDDEAAATEFLKIAGLAVKVRRMLLKRERGANG
jgi:hypothetical protein